MAAAGAAAEAAAAGGAAGRHQPDLTARVSDGFWPAFERYAAQSALPADGAADAKAFASYLRKARRPLFRR